VEETEKVNPYKWARENLSPARARAFERAYRELENSKWSKEHNEAYKKQEEIRIAFVRANLDQTNEIRNKAEQEAEELEKQANELFKKAQQIRDEAFEKTAVIQSRVYDTEEYKAQREKCSELWRKDDEAFQPKVKALMDKYLQAQTA
jgi:uncharacterized protein YhaN